MSARSVAQCAALSDKRARQELADILDTLADPQADLEPEYRAELRNEAFRLRERLGWAVRQ